MKHIYSLKFISFINSLLITFVCNAQEPNESLLEEIIENEPVNNVVDELDELNEWSTYIDQPLNLNTASRGELEKFSFLTNKQIECLLAYIYIHHGMKTIYELQLVEEMDRATIDRLAPFVCVELINNNRSIKLKSLFKSAFKYGKNDLLIRCDLPFYLSKGYQHSYYGSPVYNSFKYHFRYSDHLYLGWTAEKDKGEPFGKMVNRSGFDYNSFHLLIQNVGRLKSLCLGNYKLAFGQGLVIGNCFFNEKGMPLTFFDLKKEGINKHASTDEYNYHSGIATSYQLTSKIDLSSFYSNRLLDATIDDCNIISISKTGLHRTLSEMDHKEKARLQLLGFHCGFKGNKVGVGLTGIYYWFNAPYAPAIRDYSRYNLRGRNFYNLGANYNYRFRRLSLRGELACGKEGIATLNLMKYSAISGWELMILHRYYAYNYWGWFAHSFSEGGNIQNENGWYLALECDPLRNIHVFVAVDCFAFPWKKAYINKPSKGNDAIVKLHYYVSKRIGIDLKYRFKKKERNCTLEKEKVTSPTYHHQLRGQFDYSLLHELELRTLINWNCFSDQRDSFKQGCMIAQRLSYQFARLPLNMKGQFAYFNTDDYDTRIYAFEPGLLYQWSIPSSSGRGIRWTAVVRWDLNKHWMFAAKIGQTIYNDRRSIGVGRDLINGNKKAELQMQLRIKF